MVPVPTRPRRVRLAVFCGGVLLAGCTTSPPVGLSPGPEDASRSAVAFGHYEGAALVHDGGCRARDTIPAVYEHVMGEVQVVQAELAEDGTVLRAPVYRKAPVPRVVRPRGEITFAAPCPNLLTPDFIASLQRALAARGYFAGNVTGAMDAPTSAALKKYQSDRGLQSAQLSLETARGLGLIAVERAEP